MHATKSMKFSALTSAVVLLSLGVSCQEPRMYCTTAHGTFGAKYVLKSSNKGDPCAQQTGDILGIQTYFATGGYNGTPKFHDPSIAIRPLYAGLVLDNALSWPVEVPGAKYTYSDADAVADFKSGDPDDQDFCYVDKTKSGTVDLPLLPELPPTPDDPSTPDVDESDPGLPEQPAKVVKYEWTDAKWLVNPDAQGTQFEADLKFTEDGCTADYHVTAVYPALDCQFDKDCSKDDSGINPSFAVECDLSINVDGLDGQEDDPSTPDIDESKDWGICVLKKKSLPSYE